MAGQPGGGLPSQRSIDGAAMAMGMDPLLAKQAAAAAGPMAMGPGIGSGGGVGGVGGGGGGGGGMAASIAVPGTMDDMEL
eukprot:COSAG01_NODE_1031_length_12014_cov_27.936131_10_plen_80_part_00